MLPIAGAYVEANTIGTYSDYYGYYKIGPLGEGTYTVIAEAVDYHEDTEEGVGVSEGQTTRKDMELDEAIPPDIFEIADFGDAVVPFVIDPYLYGDWAYIGFRAQDSHEAYYNMVEVTLEIKYGQTVLRTLATSEWCYTGMEYWTIWDGLDDYGFPLYDDTYDVVLTVRDWCGNETVGSSTVGVWQWW